MSLVKSPETGATRNWLSRFFDHDSFFNDDFFNRTNMPAVNVKENEQQYEINMAVPGYKKDQFSVKIDNGILTIQGEVKTDNSEKKDNYTRKEFHFSSFSRSFTLPENADPDKVNAKYEDGLLKLEIAKKVLSNNSKKQISIS